MRLGSARIGAASGSGSSRQLAGAAATLGQGNVTVKHNIYFGTSALSEGEGMLILTLRGKQSDTPSTPTTSSMPTSPAPSPLSAPVSALPPPVQPPVSMPDSQPPPLHHSICTQKPSHLVRDLQSGEGVGMHLLKLQLKTHTR